MPAPGDTGGGCPECGETAIQIGYGYSVLGVYCEPCSLVIAMTKNAERL